MTASPPDQPSEDAGGVREQILESALQVLRDSGIRKLSQVQVARRAGVRQSHITYYFPRRHDLLAAVSARFIDGMAARVRDMAQRAGAGEPGQLVRHLAEAIADEGHMRMFAGVIVEADSDPEVRTIVVRETDRLEDALAEVLGGEDAKDRARLVVAATWGLGLYEFVMTGTLDSAARALFLQRLLNATERS